MSSLYYYTRYTASFCYNQIMCMTKWYWYNLVWSNDDYHLYLGALPLKSKFRNDADTLRDLNVKSILSVVEAAEAGEGYIYSPITTWDIHYHLPIPDFTTIDVHQLHLGADFIHEQLKVGSVYCHCRVGRSRSAAMVMAYLIKYQHFTAETAYIYLQSKRVQVQNQHADVLNLMSTY